MPVLPVAVILPPALGASVTQSLPVRTGAWQAWPGLVTLALARTSVQNRGHSNIGSTVTCLPRGLNAVQYSMFPNIMRSPRLAVGGGILRAPGPGFGPPEREARSGRSCLSQGGTEARSVALASNRLAMVSILA